MTKSQFNLSILRKAKFGHILNAFKVYTTYYYSLLVKKPKLKGYPISIGIEPTTACNLGCPECPSGLRSFTRATGNLKPETFNNVIQELRNKSLYLTFYFQGEPFIHPKFLDMVKQASKAGFVTTTSTNAHFFTDKMAQKTIESGLDKIIISLDGITQEVYEQYRVNGSLDKVLKGTKKLVKWRKALKSKTPYIMFQFLVVKPNEHQIEAAKKLAHELEVDEIAFKTAQIYDYQNGSELIPSINKYSRYKRMANGKYKLKNKLLNQCWKMWNSCVITWDGDVVPCCFDKDAKYKMGNINTLGFKEIWEKAAYTNFRQKILLGRKNIDICTNCSEGTKVWEN